MIAKEVIIRIIEMKKEEKFWGKIVLNLTDGNVQHMDIQQSIKTPEQIITYLNLK